MNIQIKHIGKSADEAAIENQSAVIEDAVDEESYIYAYDYKIADVSDKSMYNLYSITTTDAAEITNGSVECETADQEIGVKTGAMYDVYDAVNDDTVYVPAEQPQTESVSEVNEEGTDVTLVVSDIVSAHGLDMSDATFYYVSTQNLQLEFTDDNSEIIFMIELEYRNGKWTVVSTKDMQNIG